MPQTRLPSGLPPPHSPATARCWFFLRDPEFVVAFFGCLIARVVAVPMMVPRPPERAQFEREHHGELQADARAHQPVARIA